MASSKVSSRSNFQRAATSSGSKRRSGFVRRHLASTR
jgi:hypothetical protein